MRRAARTSAQATVEASAPGDVHSSIVSRRSRATSSASTRAPRQHAAADVRASPARAAARRAAAGRRPSAPEQERGPALVAEAAPLAQRREGRRHLVGLVVEQPGQDQRARAARAAARAAAAAGASGSRRPSARGGGASRRRSQRSARSSVTALSRAFAASPRSRAASESTAVTGAKPSFAAAIASTPEPQPRSANEPAGVEVEQQLEAQPRRRVRAGAERAPGVDHDLGHAGPHRRLLPRRPHVELPADEDRHVEALPALLPVVGHLLAPHLHAAARRPPPRPRAATAARRARRTARTRPSPRRPPARGPTGASSSSAARTASASSAGARTASLISGTRRLTFANSPSASAASRLRSSRVPDELLEQVALLVGEVARDHHVHDDDLVAAAAAAQRRHPAALQRDQRLPAACPARSRPPRRPRASAP